MDKFQNSLFKSHDLTKSTRRVREGRRSTKVVKLYAVPRGIVPSRATLGVPIKEIGDVEVIRGPERRTIMEKRLFVGPGWMTRTSRMRLL